MRTTLPSQLNGHGWIINLARRHDFGTPLLLPGTDSLPACSPQPSFPKSKVENRKCHGFGTGLYTTLSRPKIAKCWTLTIMSRRYDLDHPSPGGRVAGYRRPS